MIYLFSYGPITCTITKLISRCYVVATQNICHIALVQSTVTHSELGMYGIYCTQPSGFSAIYAIHLSHPCYNYYTYARAHKEKRA